MPDITINYEGNAIATTSTSGTTTLLTAGKYCDDDIEVVYVSPGGGETTYYADSGLMYTANMVMPKLFLTPTDGLYKNAAELVSIVCNDTRMLGGSGPNRINEYFNNCPKLTSVEFPYIQGLANTYVDRVFGNCPNLTTAIFGSVGYPITAFANVSVTNSPFRYDSQAGLTITIYVNAAALADIPADVAAKQPWGADNATVVYRSSVTGEIINS